MNRNTYYILALIGAFVVHTCAMSQQAVGDVPNDDCFSASLVVEGIPAFEGDNALASNVDDDEASCSPSDRDVWFEYAAGCTGFATVDTFGSGQVDTVLSVYDTCGGTELACNDDSGGLLSEVTFPVAMGVPFYVITNALPVSSSPSVWPTPYTCSANTMKSWPSTRTPFKANSSYAP